MSLDSVRIIFKYEDDKHNQESLENGATENNQIIVKANPGDTLLEVARANDISIEGACGGVCACATCHVWVSDPWYSKLPQATDMEENMLDNGQQLAYNSRLCCQVIVTEDMNDMVITVPKSSENTSGHHH